MPVRKPKRPARRRTSRSRGSRARSLAAADLRNIWHPFTQMQEWELEEPLIIEKGKGSWLYDVRGNRYLDGVSSLWCTVHGHNHPVLNRALNRQAARVSHSTMLGLSNVPAVELAEKLAALAPDGLSRVFYSDSGSTAVEIALKMAFQYSRLTRGAGTRRTKFLTLTNAYHGDTIGSVSAGGIDLFHEIFRPLLFETRRIRGPYRFRNPWPGEDHDRAALRELEQGVEKYRDELCAVVIEPLVQGAAGMLLQPKGYVKLVRELCDRHGLLLILDEVATGFGRTGTMFACEQENVSPDFLCLAKGLTGGYLPVAATLTTEKVYDAFKGRFEEFKSFFHGHTYTGNPLGCAVACASIDLFRTEKTLERLQPKIAQLRRRLESITSHSHVGDIRQCGFMAGIELIPDRNRPQLEYPPELRTGHRVTRFARSCGVITRPLGNTLIFMPPLSITPKELDRLCDVVFDGLEHVTGEIARQ
ncbi:MAG: adenosylmethionine--8-amino-7-oxononanoate transaminase [Deltaproteobacteria bacterium]|nr:adenosylmethionine--8-amino-7-oxononanoate transaminase [Deltaproteobacteria bacterium]